MSRRRIVMLLGLLCLPVVPGFAQQDPDEDAPRYKVVINHEGQYSIWPAERENPAGWRDAGFSGTRAECLAYIENHSSAD